MYTPPPGKGATTGEVGGRTPPQKKKIGRTTPTFYVVADCSARNWVYHPYFVLYNNLDQGTGPPTLKTWLRPCLREEVCPSMNDADPHLMKNFVLSKFTSYYLLILFWSLVTRCFLNLVTPVGGRFITTELIRAIVVSAFVPQRHWHAACNTKKYNRERTCIGLFDLLALVDVNRLFSD